MSEEINNEPTGKPLEKTETGAAQPETPALSKEQEEILLKRLRDLGYVE